MVSPELRDLAAMWSSTRVGRRRRVGEADSPRSPHSIQTEVQGNNQKDRQEIWFRVLQHTPYEKNDEPDSREVNMRGMWRLNPFDVVKRLLVPRGCAKKFPVSISTQGIL